MFDMINGMQRSLSLPSPIRERHNLIMCGVQRGVTSAHFPTNAFLFEASVISGKRQ